ncbi:MAG: cupin domain-containing protein [Candidatus Sulfotelmatobacter sp.]
MKSTIVAPKLSENVMGESDNDFVIAEWLDAGGANFDPPRLIAPLHLHRSDDEAWYVLEGMLCVQRGDEVVEVRAGAAVLVPRGAPHTYWNPTAEPVRYLLVMAPRILHLIEAIHALKERSPAALRAVFEEHDSELL